MTVITPGLINTGEITTAFLEDGAVTTVKLATNAVTTAKITDGDVTNAKLANDSVTINTNALALGGSLVLDTDDIGEGTTNQYFTDQRAVDAVEAETALALQNDVTINTDIKIGHHTIQDASYLKTNGIHILTDDAVTDRWSSIVLEEYGSKGFSINNPAIHGQVSGGTVASPAVVGDGVRCLNLVGNARFGTSAGALDTIGQIKITTNETQSGTNRGGAISFDVNPTGGGTDVKEIIKLDGGTTVSANIRFDRTGYFDNTRISTGSDAIVFDSPVSMADVFNLEPTDYDNFTATPAKGDIYMMTNDGADTAKNLPVVYNGTAWVYFDGTTVATS